MIQGFFQADIYYPRQLEENGSIIEEINKTNT